MYVSEATCGRCGDRHAGERDPVTGATAGAKTPVPPNNPVSCKIGATVTFASPGLSNNGAVSTGKTSATTTTGTAVSGAGCSGTGGNPLTITSKNLKCSKSTPNSPVPGCIKGDTYYDTWNQFISNGTASVLKSVKKLTINVNGVTYSIKGTSVNESPPCGSEVGFGIGGVVTAPQLPHRAQHRRQRRDRRGRRREPHPGRRARRERASRHRRRRQSERRGRRGGLTKHHRFHRRGRRPDDSRLCFERLGTLSAGDRRLQRQRRDRFCRSQPAPATPAVRSRFTTDRRRSPRSTSAETTQERLSTLCRSPRARRSMCSGRAIRQRRRQARPPRTNISGAAASPAAGTWLRTGRTPRRVRTRRRSRRGRTTV